jgi:hypothetical protein
MKRSVFGRSSLAAVVLSLGLAGCGGGGIEEGAPPPNQKGIPLDPNMVNMSKGGPGSFVDQKNAAARNAAVAKQGATAAPAEKKD